MKRLLCAIGFHKATWFFGASWNPSMYVRVCTRCDKELR